jgi:hypothetical protein
MRQLVHCEFQWLALRWWALLLAAALFSGAGLMAAENGVLVRDYEVKAAALLQFPGFIEWPPEKLPRATDPIVILVAGEGPIFGALEGLAHGRSVDRHPLVIRRWTRSEGLKDCHVLYIGPGESEHLKELTASAASSGVLLVGEGQPFLEVGGMVGFLIESGNVRFDVNRAAVESAGLKISSKLLAIVKRWNAERKP